MSALPPNHVEKLLNNKSTVDDLSHLMVKEFLTQNKSTIEGNQNLIEEIRKLRQFISDQNNEFSQMKTNLKQVKDEVQQNRLLSEQILDLLRTQTPVKQEAPVTTKSEATKENTAPLTNGFNGFLTNKNLPSFADLAKNTTTATLPTTTSSPFPFSSATDAKPSIFGNLNSTPLANAKFQSPLLFGNQNNTKPAADGEDGDEEGNANPEEYEPAVDFKPLVTLKEVEVKTGEEDEEVLFKERCKLYRFSTETKEWKEKGVGEMKILRHRQNNTFRVLMRRDQVLKLCANHRILPEIKLESVNEKQIRWSTTDYSEPESKYEVLIAKFRHEDEVKKFKAEFEKAQKQYSAGKSPSKPVPPSSNSTNSISNGKPSLAEALKIEKGTWSCTACLAQNKPEANKCACCETEKPGAVPKTNGNGPQASTLTNGTHNSPKAQQQPFGFGSLLSKPQEASPAVNGNGGAVVFGSKNLPGFGDLAKNTQNGGFLFGGENKASPFGSSSGGVSQLFGGAKQSPVLFGSQVKPTAGEGEDGDEEGNANPEEYEPAVDFKPLVTLKEVEVKTGEEDEEVLFKERCKLYRFSTETKEWKEKGVGEMKILRHRQNNTFRVLMRRDQVLKLCANHRILPEIKLESVNEKQIRWSTTDYSEPESKYEVLIAKFRHEDEAKRFKAEFEKAQIQYTASSPAKPSTKSNTAEAKSSTSLPALSELIKVEKGTWSCTQCLVQNKPDLNLCACCQSPRDGKTISTSNSATSSLGTSGVELKPVNSAFKFGGDTSAVNNGQGKVNFNSNVNIGSLVSNTQTPPVFGSSFGAKPTTPVAQTSPFTFGTKTDLPGFGDLAKNSQNGGFLFGGENKASPFAAAGNAQPLFGGAKQSPLLFGGIKPTTAAGDGEEGDEEGNANPEEYEPVLDFKPLVTLKEVEVKTGEEDEEVVFKERCKLYRFSTETKEWKEKGVGEMKILKHKENKSFRVLMRRDQILKLCANHRILPDIELESASEKQVRWSTTDYSDSEAKYEILLAKFRHEDEAKRFKAQFQSAQKNFITSPAKCAPTPATNGKPDDDVCVVNEVKATNEQINKAKKFNLPQNFYLYETKPNCAGCRGCRED